MSTPFEEHFSFPAEWEPHEATWLTYPYLDDSFPGKLPEIYPPYFRFIKEIATSEKVRINIPEKFHDEFFLQLDEAFVDRTQIEVFSRKSNDVWCRDHGPAFVVTRDEPRKKAVVDWEFNAWGGKYPYEKDNRIAGAIAKDLSLRVFRPGIVMEGGSVDFNGEGTLITTKSCLLNPNRNPGLSQRDIEIYLHDYYGVSQILWLEDGIAGDDTDGHIDDITRFILPDTVVTVVERNKNDPNYLPLHENLKLLKKMRLMNSKQLHIIELPMPYPVIHREQRLPASYANFYFTNNAVIVPTFKCKQDDEALQILSSCIPERRIIGIESSDIIWGYGSFHCLCQQEPKI
jgi:agmatine deiminase